MHPSTSAIASAGTVANGHDLLYLVVTGVFLLIAPPLSGAAGRTGRPASPDRRGRRGRSAVDRRRTDPVGHDHDRRLVT
jgi:hypothetical protein